MADLIDEGLRERGYKVPVRPVNVVKNNSNPAAQALNSVVNTVRRPFKAVDQVLGDVGDKTETVHRLAHFISKIRQGYDVRTAGEMVKAYHVDYRDLTKFESNVMRRAIPYYAFWRKNTPIVARLAIEKPWIFSNLGHLVANSSKAVGMQEGEEPEYLERSLAIPLFRRDDGTIAYLNWNLPVTDLARFTLNNGLDNARTLGSMMNPLLKIPAEYVFNENVGLGSQLERYDNEQVPLFQNMNPDSPLNPKISARLTGNILDNMGVARNFRQDVGRFTANEREPDGFKQVPQIPLFNSLIPLKHPQAVKASKAYERRDQLTDYMKKKREEEGVQFPEWTDLKPKPVTKTTISNAVKEIQKKKNLDRPFLR
jgi:hypothetical protein